jgi:splicing factor 3B subunit 3
MHLYNLTAWGNDPGNCWQFFWSEAARNNYIAWNSSGTSTTRGSDSLTGKIATVFATDVFGSIRSLAVFRLTGGTKGVLPYHCT